MTLTREDGAYRITQGAHTLICLTLDDAIQAISERHEG